MQVQSRPIFRRMGFLARTAPSQLVSGKAPPEDAKPGGYAEQPAKLPLNPDCSVLYPRLPILMRVLAFQSSISQFSVLSKPVSPPRAD